MGRAHGSVVQMSGPIALVGSGEFLDVMRPIDAALLAGRPERAVFLPTAAAGDGPDRVDYWIQIGTTHFRGLGVEPVPLRVLDRHDADDPTYVDQVAGAGMIYLSGGNPGYLADTLRDTAIWRAILDAWHDGAAIAGCSAGACALSAVADDFRNPGRYSGLGLAVAPEIAAIPHFDRFDQIAPEIGRELVASAPPGAITLGIDEETALIGDGTSWVVDGRRAVWRLDRDGSRTRFGQGETVDLGPR